MRVRKAALSDMKVLNKLLGSLFTQEAEFKSDAKLQKKAIKNIIESNTLGDIFVIEKKGRVVGMVNILYTYSTALDSKVALLEDMVVLKKYRGKKYGSKLLKEVLKRLNKKKINRVTLLSDHDNLDAHRFYKKQGFKKSEMLVLRRG